MTYEKGFLSRLLETKPDYSDLIEIYTLEFMGGEKVQETKAKLLMCGDLFGALFNSKTIEHETHLVSLKLISKEDFQGVLQAIEFEAFDRPIYSEDVQNVMKFISLHLANVPEKIMGKERWNNRGVEVGEVGPLPKRLLEVLRKPCVIAKDGTKIID